jgi:nucleotide-binding universal stress UspA family protein
MKLTLQGGYPASVINDYANKHKFDLVVMGARGQPQIQYILLGSVAKKILQIITKDVLVVPSK